MDVKHIKCGPFANRSEEEALKTLTQRLSAHPGTDRVLLLSNLAHSYHPERQSDEIDLVAICRTGVHVIEIKHWSRGDLKRRAQAAADQAEKLAMKTRRIAGKVKKVVHYSEFITGKFLLTNEGKSLANVPSLNGAGVYARTDWQVLLNLDGADILSDHALDVITKAIHPRLGELVSGELRRIDRIVDLKPLYKDQNGFHRMYEGRDGHFGGRVIVHLYDLTASSAPNALDLAQREFRAIQRYQISPAMPRIMDSFREVPDYPGELYFFTLTKSDTPSVASLIASSDWTGEDRLDFIRDALEKLQQLHDPEDGGGLIHRTLSAATVLVHRAREVRFGGWQWAKLPVGNTISGDHGDELPPEAAPEVRAGGLAAADRRSDVFSLCTVLRSIVEGDEDPRAREVSTILEQGIDPDPDKRASLEDLLELLSPETADGRQSEPPATDEDKKLPPSLWSEGMRTTIKDDQYEIICRLGSGAIGTTFKLVQVGEGEETYGHYVAKIAENEILGPAALEAYKKVRAHSSHQHLAAVYTTSAEWKPGGVLALLEWVEGYPLSEYLGCLEIHAEEVGESGDAHGVETLALAWLDQLLQALGELHKAGFVHADVSPGNIIVDGSDVTLIDYDLATEVGKIAAGKGTTPYHSPAVSGQQPVTFADDLYSLAATLFHALTDRDPFLFKGVRQNGQGLAWQPEEREQWPLLTAILDDMVKLKPQTRLTNAPEALARLRKLRAEAEGQSPPDSESPTIVPLQPNIVPRLTDLLRMYPGSRHGNSETRGLDSALARETYVETGLDREILQEVNNDRLSLIILCGNAGDGKTAFLQNLACALTGEEISSAQRIFETTLPDSKRLMANLDGAAAWEGQTADELMDRIMEPFHEGPPRQKLVHIVAVNDGRLLEWLEDYERRHGETRLTEQIAVTLLDREQALDPHIRLIELNHRSLVGGLDANNNVTSDFVDQLLAQLMGGKEAADIWKDCATCAAQNRCMARRSALMFGASEDPAWMNQGEILRNRLLTALQAVHQRGEVHITARELKATLSYVLFGLFDCDDLHKNPERDPPRPWDLLFDPESPARQGELLRELSRLDPALDAHPRVDRYLLSPAEPDPTHGAPRYPELSLRSARRRGWLSWTDDQIRAVGGNAHALDLFGGKHISDFRDFPRLNEAEQKALCERVCHGIARLEDLPSTAFERPGQLPIRIVPRTPTESALWVEKSLGRFHLAAEPAPASLEHLHRALILSYTHADGAKSRLRIPLALFSMLLDLEEGMQLASAAADAIFANVGVFTSRIMQEDERRLLAWAPAAHDALHEIAVVEKEGRQVIALTEFARGV